MREIKFRAWDKLSNQWIENFRIYPDGKVEMKTTGSLGDFARDLELVQYTGLHDKNDKEIYEGDIVQIPEALFDGESFVCEWDSEFLSFEFIGRYKTKLGDYPENCIGGACYGKMEVIGNIWENPIK